MEISNNNKIGGNFKMLIKEDRTQIKEDRTHIKVETVTKETNNMEETIKEDNPITIHNTVTSSLITNPNNYGTAISNSQIINGGMVIKVRRDPGITELVDRFIFVNIQI